MSTYVITSVREPVRQPFSIMFQQVDGDVGGSLNEAQYDASVAHAAMGGLRKEVEEYVCHRDELPFEHLEPFVDKIMDRDVVAPRTSFPIQGRRGASVAIDVESDETFRLVYF
jgi:hypothetical protein